MSSMNATYKAERMEATDGLQVSDRVYNATIGLVVLFGLALNFLMYRVFGRAILQWNYIAVLVAYFAGAFGGMFIVYKSQNPAVSMLGFTLLAAAMGLLLTFALGLYDESTIVTALSITGIVTAAMMVLGTIYPNFFLSIGRALGFSLLGCIAVELIGGLIMHREMQWLDWVVALVFCGYIGFDWARAQRYPKTLDNAIDSAADIYVDVVNLFLRILEIAARSKSND